MGCGVHPIKQFGCEMFGIDEDEGALRLGIEDVGRRVSNSGVAWVTVRAAVPLVKQTGWWLSVSRAKKVGAILMGSDWLSLRRRRICRWL